ncbi:TVP38/TMEM64 family protein [Sporosarcina thermotolerans]|uniref:TVP38/TMEM64 family membrane protein n=1 Tax=Sporosarcina thermotolerans TaxID=633404 RepID=A0AAW9A8N2_9BACL|nr:TVP38/TMEM64 family protein [Sporosarcina thermotolerans]MDW0116993.1 TVP38/TMEM64 family protein [Sporosarcina thermotolerans]WHT47897.1 TVP38/TMEM64 family protein [Sporosarcina thermotolerans]
MSEWLDVDKISELAAQYKALGPLIGLLLPFIESFLPFLPLFVFVIANTVAYGIWYGFILSWAGTVVGSYVVFLIIRKYGRNRLLSFLTKHERVQRLIGWVERNGFGPLFILLCFPFTPSALVNLVAGLSNMKKKSYLLVLLAGKFVMIFTIGFIGYDLKALLTQPIRTAIVVGIIVLLWVVGKYFEKRLDKKVEEESSTMFYDEDED